jgi:hypothetical protein
VQVVGLHRSHEVGAGRRGCCTCLLYRAAACTVIFGVARPHHSITASGDPSQGLTVAAQIISWAGLGLLTAGTRRVVKSFHGDAVSFMVHVGHLEMWRRCGYSIDSILNCFDATTYPAEVD